MDNADQRTTTLTLISGNSETKRIETRRHCEKLLELHTRFTSGLEKRLAPGMLACWKLGMRNRRTPDYGTPVVVVEILSDFPIDEEHGPGSGYYRERLDIILGFVDDDGEFSMFHYDSRRFEPFVE